MSDRSRPLGVQLLVTRQSLLSRQTTDDRTFVNNHRRSGSGSAVGRGAERVRSSLWQETHDPGREESLGSTYTPRE